MTKNEFILRYCISNACSDIEGVIDMSEHYWDKLKSRGYTIPSKPLNFSSGTYTSKEIPDEVKQRFNTFYNEYRKKVGKEGAYKAFIKLSTADQKKCISNTIRFHSIHDKMISDGNKNYIPAASSWVNDRDGKYWRNEDDTTNESGKDINSILGKLTIGVSISQWKMENKLTVEDIRQCIAILKAGDKNSTLASELKFHL